MSRLRDQFIAAIPFIQGKKYILDECVVAAGQWKKNGGLSAEEYDQILAAVAKARRLNAILTKTKIK